MAWQFKSKLKYFKIHKTHTLVFIFYNRLLVASKQFFNFWFHHSAKLAKIIKRKRNSKTPGAYSVTAWCWSWKAEMSKSSKNTTPYSLPTFTPLVMKWILYGREQSSAVSQKKFPGRVTALNTTWYLANKIWSLKWETEYGEEKRRDIKQPLQEERSPTSWDEKLYLQNWMTETGGIGSTVSKLEINTF